MRRPLTLPILLLLASAGASTALAAPVTLNVAEDGWAATASRAFPPDPSAMGGTNSSSMPTENGKIKLADVPSGARVFAYNLNSNLCVVGLPDALSRTTIGREGATHLVHVTVRVTDGAGSNAKPYGREASVELQDGKRTQSSLTGIGTATFTWVEIGDATITVKTRGDDNKPRVVTQKVTLDRDGLSDFVVPITGTPAPASGTANAASASATPVPAPSSGGNAVGNLLSLAIGLGVVGGLAFFAWRYAKANPDKVKEGLTKIGADVPAPLDPDPPATTPSATPAPAAAPSGPILLDPTSDPIVVPQTPISVAPIAITGIPKLIGSDGSAFELPEGETVVGREALGGLMISHDTVSRRHARLLRSGPSVTVEDLGSTNGTWVNDAPAPAPAPLTGGETVRFGQVSYRYEA